MMAFQGGTGRRSRFACASVIAVMLAYATPLVAGGGGDPQQAADKAAQDAARAEERHTARQTAAEVRNLAAEIQRLANEADIIGGEDQDLAIGEVRELELGVLLIVDHR